MRITFTRRRRNTGAVLAVALVVSATVIWKASFATFVVTTSNPNNAWTSGNLVLQAQDGAGASVTGAAVYTMTGMVPSATVTDHCITVKYTGNITAGAPVRLYSASTTNSAAVNSHSLGSYLNLQIDEGTGSTDTNCTGFSSSAVIFDSTHRSGATSATVIAGSMMDFTTNQTGYASGTVTSWTPAVAAPTKSFRFRVTFPGSGSNTTDTDLMNQTAQTTFTWEVQS